MSVQPAIVSFLMATNPEWRPAFEPFVAPAGQPLDPDGAPRHIFGIDGGLASVRYETGHAVALAGAGAILGGHGLFSSGSLPLAAHAETEVSGLRASLATARAICGGCPDSRRIFEAIEQAATFEIALNLQLALNHKTRARTAFYLLKAREALGNALPLTHHQLSVISGIRRASITTDLAALCEEGAIDTGRGFIDILRRPLLTAAVGPGWSELERLSALAA